MTNRQLAAARTREKLVEAAKQIICEKGLTNTAVDEITQRCRVSKGTFYTYFKRKEDVVYELSRGMFAAILEQAMGEEADFVTRLGHYMTRFSEYIEKSSLKLCQEWIKNVVIPELVTNEIDREKLQRDISALRELLKQGIDRGELRADAPAEALAGTLCDLLYGQMLCWSMSGGSYGFAERTEQFCREHLADLLRPYLV